MPITCLLYLTRSSKQVRIKFSSRAVVRYVEYSHPQYSFPVMLDETERKKEEDEKIEFLVFGFSDLVKG